jgi:rubredoxin
MISAQTTLATAKAPKVCCPLLHNTSKALSKNHIYREEEMNATEPKYAAAKMPFGAILEKFHCPVCGAVLVPDREGPCCHVAYMYSDDAYGFFNVATQYKGMVNHVMGEFEDSDWEMNPAERMIELVRSNSMIHIAVETSGMACGPVSSTLYVGIEFNP